MNNKRNYNNYRNIYDVCYITLQSFIDQIVIKYIDNDDKANQEIIELLTTQKSPYESEFNIMLKKLANSELDTEFAKRLMMLIIASKSFIYNNYERENNINVEQSSDIIETLAGYDATMVIKEFYANTEFAMSLIDDAKLYLDSSYILQNCSIDSGYNTYRREIMRINPYEIFEFATYIPRMNFLSSEFAIQKFLNLYDQALGYIVADELGEEEQYENKDEFFCSVLLNLIHQEFPDKAKFTNFLKFILSSIYEFLVISTNSNNPLVKENLWIKRELENKPIEDIINQLLNDYEFAIKIYDIFLASNDSLFEGELFERRTQFKEKGNVAILKRINPFYNEEELVYKVINENESKY